MWWIFFMLQQLINEMQECEPVCFMFSPLTNKQDQKIQRHHNSPYKDLWLYSVILLLTAFRIVHFIPVSEVVKGAHLPHIQWTPTFFLLGAKKKKAIIHFHLAVSYDNNFNGTY
jgi:hypothetical protein